MRETLIVPTENAPSLRDIKRALLTFDKVLLVDPGDRDIIPSNAWISSILGVPFLGMDVGPVRPIGKVARHDEEFQRLIDEISPALKQGLAEVISTYNRSATRAFTIGAVLTGGYPLDPRFVMSVYRSVASNQQLLSAVLDQSALSALHNPDNHDCLVLSGVGDGAINQVPALPLLEIDSLADDSAKALTSVARARLAALVKFTGYCEAKELVPTYTTDGYSRAVSTLLQNTRRLLADESNDPFWIRRNKVLDLGFETILEPNALDRVSVEDVIALRTKEWGRLEASREKLFHGVFELASTDVSEDEFEAAIKGRLVEIRGLAGQIEAQRRSIAFRIKCELGSGALGAGLALLNLQAPLRSVAAILAIGGVWFFQRCRTYGDELIKLRELEREAKRGAGFALSRFFGEIGQHVSPSGH